MPTIIPTYSQYHTTCNKLRSSLFGLPLRRASTLERALGSSGCSISSAETPPRVSRSTAPQVTCTADKSPPAVSPKHVRLTMRISRHLGGEAPRVARFPSDRCSRSRTKVRTARHARGKHMDRRMCKHKLSTNRTLCPACTVRRRGIRPATMRAWRHCGGRRQVVARDGQAGRRRSCARAAKRSAAHSTTSRLMRWVHWAG